MRLIKVLATCSLVAMAMLMAGNSFAQRAGGPGGGGYRGLPPEVAALRARIQQRTYTFEPTGQQMPYSVFLPRKFDKKKPMPLVIALHGAGVTPDSIAGGMASAADQYGYILAAPMGYTTSGWYGLAGPTDPETARLSELDVMNVLGIMRAQYNIDPRRIYIAGHSMGGIGAVHIAAKYPDIWAAVGAMSPGFTRASMNREEFSNFHAAPIVVLHGERDEIIPVDLVRTWVAGLKARNVPYKYYEYTGGNHVSTLRGGAERVFEFFQKYSQPDVATKP